MSELLEYKEAFFLKELGFDEPSIGYFTMATGKLISSSGYASSEFTKVKLSDIHKDYCLAPTYGQAFKWFRDNHGLYAEIELDQTMEPKFCFSINWYKETDLTVEWINMTDRPEFFLEYSYEKAELSCLRRLIEIVKQQQKISD